MLGALCFTNTLKFLTKRELAVLGELNLALNMIFDQVKLKPTC